MCMNRPSLVLALLLSLIAMGTGFAETHVVAKKETLSQIAEKHKVSVKSIVAANNLRNANVIKEGQKLKIPHSPTAPVEYKVKRGDSVARIAKKHNTSISAIIAYNQLKYPDRIKPGQLLKIPQRSSASKGTTTTYLLPETVKKKMAKTRVKKWKWKYIVIHHSASARGSMAGMDRYHREERHMENGLAYHFVIGNGSGMGDGEIGIGNRWKKQIQGGHLASAKLNEKSIGICLVGNFDEGKPTKAQMKSLYGLLKELKRKTGLKTSAIKTHRQINTKPTRCPGKYFPVQEVLQKI